MSEAAEEVELRLKQNRADLLEIEKNTRLMPEVCEVTFRLNARELRGLRLLLSNVPDDGFLLVRKAPEDTADKARNMQRVRTEEAAYAKSRNKMSEYYERLTRAAEYAAEAARLDLIKLRRQAHELA